MYILYFESYIIVYLYVKGGFGMTYFNIALACMQSVIVCLGDDIVSDSCTFNTDRHLRP